jgi:hypothetical protein
VQNVSVHNVALRELKQIWFDDCLANQ